jgi:hypothetical protein
LYQCVFECAGPVVLSQQVGERLIRKLLKALAAITRKQLKRLSGFRIKGDQFAGHRYRPRVLLPFV